MWVMFCLSELTFLSRNGFPDCGWSAMYCICRCRLSAISYLLPLVHRTLKFPSFRRTQLCMQSELLLMDFWKCALLSLCLFIRYVNFWSFMYSVFLLDSCREDCPRSAGVVDKINIFRPDRVFMVMMQHLSGFFSPLHLILFSFTRWHWISCDCAVHCGIALQNCCCSSPPA